ncbi:hypothetical protein [Carnobacterium funditum]|uniref:hypothetical protein n=1 Tax=Carnobacterium funditum TaxID=2752 RepID=UPI00068C4A72|nr:hypothetical protein [Carnobacterium funditum]
MKNIRTKEASEKWGISDRRIRVLRRNGRIEGAIKVGRNWSIPFETVKLVDAREKIGKEYFGTYYDSSYIVS